MLPLLVRLVAVTAFLMATGCEPVASGASPPSRRIVLVAGEVTRIDTLGHHDYLAGCECLDLLLKQSPGIETHRVSDGWPADDREFDGAACLVFYTDGGGKQAFLQSPDRIAKLQALVDAGAGLVMIHQAVDFPEKFAAQGRQWLGGIYLKGRSGRGHWPSIHAEFPQHPITRGVTAWQIKDGWLNELQFVEEMRGVTPLVWSGKDVVESRAGLDGHIVGWAYERPTGGRSFSFTGLDAHSAWELDGMRQLVVNGVLWASGAEIPPAGAPCQVDPATLRAMQTPREQKPPAPAAGSTK